MGIGVDEGRVPAELPWLRPPAPDPEERMTLADYLPQLAADPHLADSAAARLYRAVREAGVEMRDGLPRYRFFAEDLFGLDAVLERLVEDYLHPAALGLEVRRRLLLLVGPVGGGKSTLVSLLKRGLEALTRTDAGRVFAIEGCPMQEDPWHLLPTAVRAETAAYLGLRRPPEGDLCPWCRHRLREEFGGRYWDVPVHRVVFSEADRVGIGTFVPADPKSQDMADLVGSLDFSTITTYGSESDPRAWRFDGELYRANRGLMEFQEMLKLDEKFLYHLLGLTQEGRFKVGRFALVAADEVIVGHSNEPEFRAFQANPKNEALLSRMMVLRVPYTLSVREEARIYGKLMAGSEAAHGVHWAPGTLEAAAAVSVASRLSERGRAGLDPEVTLAILDGDPVPDVSEDERAAVLEAARADGQGSEGMEGIDPRYVVNRIASAVMHRRLDCIMPEDVLSAIGEGIAASALVERLGRERVEAWIGVARRRLEQDRRRVVRAAFLEEFEAEARALFRQYLEHLGAFVRADQGARGGSPAAADERLLTAVEAGLGVGDGERLEFRHQLWARVEAAGGTAEAWDYRIHPGLADALENQLWQDLKALLRLPVTRPSPREGADPRVAAVLARLEARGYCPRCALEALRGTMGVWAP